MEPRMTKNTENCTVHDTEEFRERYKRIVGTDAHLWSKIVPLMNELAETAFTALPWYDEEDYRQSEEEMEIEIHRVLAFTESYLQGLKATYMQLGKLSEKMFGAQTLEELLNAIHNGGNI